MTRRIVLTLGLLVGWSAGTKAQSSICPAGTAGSPAQFTQDACQKAVDLFQYMAPQLGGVITGGNATLGQGGALGGLGHFTVGLRVNVIQGSVPKLDDPNVFPVATGARASTFITSDTPLPMLTADGAVGLYAGYPIGLTNILALDGLVSATYVPELTKSNVRINPDNPVKFGFGGRVGLLQESIITPGVSFTYLIRDLPVITMTGTTGGATLRVNDLDEQTRAWRFVASKNLIMFGFALGIGQDKYKSTAGASASGTLGGLTVSSTQVAVSQEMSRTNVFGDLSFNIPFFRFVLEGGQITGGAAPFTINQFNGRGIVDARLYGSLGLRFVW
jgi:hypothetical protein